MVYYILLSVAFCFGWWLAGRFMRRPVRVVINHKDGTKTVRVVRMNSRELKRWRRNSGQ